MKCTNCKWVGDSTMGAVKFCPVCGDNVIGEVKEKVVVKEEVVEPKPVTLSKKKTVKKKLW